ncbi:ABC transporter permease [Actinomyces viscosus]|uniref:ABC transporter permease n=1 Tax=Actinomyces viscosus TaxID=1656 RepID=UPI0028EEC22C|nr:ABC transporter permease [Actinomyces viscosus]
MRTRVLAFAHRFSSGVRVSWASSTAFATLGTAVVTLLVLPLLDVLFDVLMGSDLSAPDLVRTGYAAALVALAVSVASGVVSTVATDRMLGVFQEVHTRRRLDVAYWLSVAVVPALLATLTAAVAIGAVFALSPQHDAAMLERVVALTVPAIVCGLLMGVAAAGVGVNLPDPYLGATVISTFLPLLTGVIVPLEQCPAWLRALARAVPVGGTLTALDAPAAAVPVLLGRDLAVAAVWAGIGLVVTRRAATRLRQGRRTDTI